MGAGAGEAVLIVDEGNSARQVVGLATAPIRAVVVGIVDELRVDGEAVVSIDGKEVGTYKRVLGKLRDRYVLELDQYAAEGIDRRLLLAFAVALDALQDR